MEYSTFISWWTLTGIVLAVLIGILLGVVIGVIMLLAVHGIRHRSVTFIVCLRLSLLCDDRSSFIFKPHTARTGRPTVFTTFGCNRAS